MSDAPTEVETPEVPEGQETEPPAKAETDWAAEAKKWEKRAKENSLAAARLAEIEESTKTEAQKLSERADAAEKQLAAERLDSARTQVALEKGLTAAQAKRLVGSSREEFLDDADQLLTDLGKQSTTPRADLSQGAKARTGEQTPGEALADILRSKRG